MINIVTVPDSVQIRCENSSADAEVTYEIKNNALEVYLTAGESRPEFLILRWKGYTENDVKVMGDAWERSYADLAWKGIETNRFMPWYFIVSDGSMKSCYGVKTGCGSFVSFQYDASGITAWIDVRCGQKGVELNGRKLHAATFAERNYGSDYTEFSALQDFCHVMCENPIFPKKPVYGGNNWYYAYGNSSYDEIIEDTKLQIKLSEGLENRPYMVIDDCWQVKKCAGPWIANEKFGDMKKLASEIKSMGAIPGIWVRFLTDYNENIPQEWLINKDGERCLDISRSEVLDFIKGEITKIRGWGYELIKHDFSTYDLFGSWGKNLDGTITKGDNWTFFNKNRTNAELVLDFYRAVREAAGDAVVIGCNTVSHLSAGLVEVNRIGDDTSGENWVRTRDYGINTLAFRLPQHKAFYDVDADCVGILGDNISWNLNRQWLKLLSESGTPLFVSCPNIELCEDMLDDLKKAYKYASCQKNIAEPLDWMYNNLPRIWKIDDSIKRFDWIENIYPEPKK